MLTLFFIGAALLLISIGETVKDLRSAPIGYEDEAGFHQASNAESEF